MTCRCGAETPDGIHLCHACCARLEQLLCELDGIVEDLVSAIPRASLTASYGERVSASGSLHAPLPINDTALDAHMALDKYLREICTRLTRFTGIHTTRRDSSGLASYLLTHMGTLRTQEWAGDVEGELGKLLRECENVTRVHEQKVFAGTCAEDGSDLYARKGEGLARCRTCGETYDVAKWKAYAATAQEYHIDTPAELAKALANPKYGIAVTVNQICMWARRGKIERANEEADEDGAPIKPKYRLSDVLDMNAKKELRGTA